MAQPEHGTILGFETDPAFDWDPPTGRFGAVKILGVDQWGNRVVATLAGVFTTMPTLADVATAPVLTLNRFSFNGRPAVFGTSGFDAATQDRLTPLGVVSITDHERRLAEACATISAPSRCMFNLEAEWRWEHDHQDYIASHERKKADDDERRRQADERYETRLKGLTWGQLRDETHFDRWKPSPPFPPATFTRSAEAHIRATIDQLEALGPRPKKRQARAALKACVEWFNEADAAAGYVIETEEREDVMRTLEEIAVVAGHSSLLDEVDSWREW